jgi:hypothetical protein
MFTAKVIESQQWPDMPHQSVLIDPIPKDPEALGLRRSTAEGDRGAFFVSRPYTEQQLPAGVCVLIGGRFRYWECDPACDAVSFVADYLQVLEE